MNNIATSDKSIKENLQRPDYLTTDGRKTGYLIQTDLYEDIVTGKHWLLLLLTPLLHLFLFHHICRRQLVKLLR